MNVRLITFLADDGLCVKTDVYQVLRIPVEWKGDWRGLLASEHVTNLVSPESVSSQPPQPWPRPSSLRARARPPTSTLRRRAELSTMRDAVRSEEQGRVGERGRVVEAGAVDGRRVRRAHRLRDPPHVAALSPALRLLSRSLRRPRELVPSLSRRCSQTALTLPTRLTVLSAAAAVVALPASSTPTPCCSGQAQRSSVSVAHRRGFRFLSTFLAGAGLSQAACQPHARLPACTPPSPIATTAPASPSHRSVFTASHDAPARHPPSLLMLR